MRASKILPSIILVLTIFLSDYFFDYSKNIKIIFLKFFQPVTEIPFVIGDISNRLGFFFSSQNNLYLEIEALNNEIEKLNFEILKMKNIESENYYPSRGPFTIKQLEKVKLSDPFIQYMRKWDGFVKDEPQ